MRGFGGWALVAVVVVSACSTPPASPPNEFKVGPQGGTFAHNGVSLTIPPGAVSSDVVVTIGQTAASGVASPPPGVTLPTDLVLLTPHGTVFSAPVTVRIPYSGRNEGRVALRLDDESDTTWERLTGVTFADNVATYETTRFSVIALGTGDYSIGGELAGLTGTVVLQNNGRDDLTLSANGPFTFSQTVLEGWPYAVTVHTQPAGQTCTVANASGPTGGGPVATIRVTCSANTHTVGGSVTGLNGNLVLQNNGGDDLVVTTAGAFTFPSPIADGSGFAVTVFDQPPTQSCTVTGGSGSVAGADITSVSVACVTNTYAVGGSLSGLSGTVVLRNNGGDDLTLSADGPFAFATPVDDGTAYAVTVLTQPATQTCTVASGGGTLAGAPISTVAVTCTTNTHAVGGTVSGLNGTVVLRNNGGDDLTLSSNGAFTFATPVPDGAGYAVTVFTQPSTQTCVVTGGSGTIAGGPVASVTVVCTTNTYAVRGAVSGLVGTVVLRNSGGDDVTVTADGSFAFPTPVDDGTGYTVTVFTQPATQTCTVAAGNGIVSGADVTTVVVTCSVNMYPVGGSISGLVGTVVLRNNGGDDLTVSANGAFIFSSSIADGSPYAVSVFTQPATHTCTITGGAGMVSGAPVTSVAVSCAINTYAVGGTVSGLNGTVVLRNNGGDDLTVNASGAFTFATPVADGAAFAVTVFTQPATQTCTVSGGTGSVSGAPVIGVAVACTTNTYAVGGAVAGLSGTVVLQNNGGDDLTLSADGPFAFVLPVVDGASFAVTVLTQPASQTCSIAGGVGSISGAPVSTVAVTCVPAFSVGGTVSAFRGPMVLRLNGTDDVAISAGGAFTFNGKLADAASWSVAVATTPRDVYCTISNGAGVITGANVTSIDVACKGWIYPASFSNYISPAGKAAHVDPAVASNGDAIIAWYQESGAQRRILKSERRGGVWTHPTSMANAISPAGSLAMYPTVAISDNGTALIAWLQSNGTHDQVFLSEYRGGVWTHPATLASHISLAGSATSAPSVAINASGEAIIAWSQSDGVTPRVYMSQYRGGAWTHPASVASAISPAGFSGQNPVVAISNNGDALIVWNHLDATWHIVKSEFRAGVWSHPTGAANALSVPGQHAVNPAVAMNASGDAVVAFREHNGRDYMQYFAHHRSGAWVKPANLTQHIGPDVGAVQSTASVDINAAGDAIIGWTQFNGASRNHALVSQFRAGTWTHPAGLTDELAPVATAWVTDVALNSASEAVVMIASYGNVYKAEYRGGVWKRALTTADQINPSGANYAEAPRVAFDGQGRALASWRCNETSPSSDPHVYISTYE